MLEIKNLTKVYKTKGGADVTALDDVSINFDKTGLVFLLGKSGSGKSTLLNLAGGLDEPTSGEVIVMGKSSKDFSGSDFDSYRNTFIGFIFQEYNVLNEFNVEDNIALALELQGKKKDHEKIAAILKDVDLEEFAKRKPNTLSGGQKQRIAIARALVKDPQIIMADEPTGALDSATGKQVLDTLKKLSETRLVIVVSHDREFAEIYGDRIVELKDGKIISDVSKTKEEPKVVGTISRIGENTLSIRRDKPLDQATIAALNAFLMEGEGEVLITKDGKDIANFKRASRIDDANGRETFHETPAKEAEVYDGSKTKFIRSRLPAGKAFKIGASGLKLKPVRLVFTIFLSFVAFVLFGLLSTMMFYDGNAVLRSSLLDSDYEFLTLTKSYEERVTYSYENSETYTYTTWQRTKFTPAEIEALGGSGAVGIYDAYINDFGNLSATSQSANQYTPAIFSLTILPEGHPLRDNINGEYPQTANEICVSSYFYECAKNGQFKHIDEEGNRTAKPINNESDLIGETVLLGYNEKPFKVTGIFPSGTIPEVPENPRYDEVITEQIRNTLHALAFIADGAQSSLASTDGNSVNYFDYANREYLYQRNEDDYSSIGSSVKVYDPAAPARKQLDVFRFDDKTGALGDNELILTAEWLYSPYSYDYIEKLQNDHYAKQPSGGDTGTPEWQAWEEEGQGIDELRIKLNKACNILMGYPYWDDDLSTNVDPTKEQIPEAIQILKEIFEEPIELELFYRSYKYGSSMETSCGNYRIVGIAYSANRNYYNSGIYCSQTFYDASEVYSEENRETKYEPEDDAEYNSLLMPFTKNEAALDELLEKLFVTNPDTDVFYSMDNEIYNSVSMVNGMVENISLIFLIAGIVIAVFAALLLLNFITMSISSKKKEIGILRAVGARGSDVFKIFFAESGIIVGICIVLALIGSLGLTIFLNSYLKAQAGLQATLFVFGPLTVVIMLAVAVAVALIGTFLPVFSASRKKPVDSIRAL